MFRNILFVSHGVFDETEALKQALSIARNNQGALKILVIHPELPEALAVYKDGFLATIFENIKRFLIAASHSITGSSASNTGDFKVGSVTLQSGSVAGVSVQIEVESGATPAVRIVRHVLKDRHDLVIKDAEVKDGGRGFMALDTELLRKCPCPVWLCRPISKSRQEIKVGVAVDPESAFPEGDALSIQLLQIARAYADTCNGKLTILSCWDFMSERSLRHNPWIKLKEHDVAQIVDEARAKSRASLDRLLSNAKVSGEVLVSHIRGSPSKVIPGKVLDDGIDILVMGTLGRTGLAGYFIGNTSENIIQELTCSLLALKPDGFVSPISLN